MQASPRSRRQFLHAAGALSIGAFASRSASAQASATPLRLLCTGPAGSIPDTVARRYAEQLGARYSGGVVVDNRPGAAGQIAIGALKQAAADGTTLLLAQGAIATVYPFLYAKLGYDPAADLKPVSVAAEATLALAVGPVVPAGVRSLGEFIDWARAHPALANYGSPGPGTLPHVLGALLFRGAKIDAQHVAYAGGPAAMVDLLGGRLACLVLPEGLLRPQHAAGKLRLLATSGTTRSPFLPDVPTFVEQGHARLAIREWFGFFMPGAASPSAQDSASQALRAVAESTALTSALGDMGMLASAGTPAAMSDRIATEQRYWREVIDATGIRLES
jgi:tripartite-type tricarboxylate transporter receptor subunit TctC